MDRWNIIFNQGATYQATITVTGVEDIETATNWKLVCAMPNQSAFLTASTDNGMIIATAQPNKKTIVVPALTTVDFPLGNGRYDFEIEWTGDVVRRYIANGYLQVNPQVGG